MKHLLLLACGLCLAAPIATSSVSAHVMPWRDDVSRQLGYGHCAKGPCMKRTCWAPSRPHHHVNGRVVVDRYGGPECWAGNDHEIKKRYR